jgi:hypothetical protein
MASKPTIVNQLAEARVLDPRNLTDEQVDAINKLTDAEVKQLISIRRKVGDFSHPARHDGGAWIL